MTLKRTVCCVVALILSAWGLAFSQSVASDARRQVKMGVDLTRFPAGTYRIVDTTAVTYEERTEGAGQDPAAQAINMKQVVTMEMTYTPPVAGGEGEIAVTIERVQVDLGGPVTGSYDSAGPADAQLEALARQYRGLVGRTARATVTATQIKPFKGLDASWDQLAKDIPELAQSAEASKTTCGDAMLDHFFSMTNEVGPAQTRTVGDVWTIATQRQGVGGQMRDVDVQCTLTGVKDSDAVVAITWKLNEMKPSATPSGQMTMSGVDEEGSAEVKLDWAFGMPTGLARVVKRVDQTARANAAGQTVQQTTTTMAIKTVSMTARAVHGRRPTSASDGVFAPTVTPEPAPIAAPVATTPKGIAKAVLTAYQKRDIVAWAPYYPESEKAKEVLAKIVQGGEQDPTYAALFSGWRWESVEAWDGKVGDARYWRYEDSVEAWVPYGKESEDVLFVVKLAPHEGRWLFDSLMVVSVDSWDAASTDPGPTGVAAKPTPVPAAATATTPKAIAKAILTAYKKRDLEAWTPYARDPEKAKEVYAEIMSQREKHPVYGSLFKGWRWDSVQAWQGGIGDVRYLSSRRPVEAWVTYGIEPTSQERFVVTLELHNGRWCFEDLNSRDAGAWAKASATPPPGAPAAATPSASVTPPASPAPATDGAITPPAGCGYSPWGKGVKGTSIKVDVLQIGVFGDVEGAMEKTVVAADAKTVTVKTVTTKEDGEPKEKVKKVDRFASKDALFNMVNSLGQKQSETATFNIDGKKVACLVYKRGSTVTYVNFDIPGWIVRREQDDKVTYKVREFKSWTNDGWKQAGREPDLSSGAAAGEDAGKPEGHAYGPWGKAKKGSYIAFEGLKEGMIDDVPYTGTQEVIAADAKTVTIEHCVTNEEGGQDVQKGRTPRYITDEKFYSMLRGLGKCDDQKQVVTVAGKQLECSVYRGGKDNWVYLCFEVPGWVVRKSVYRGHILSFNYFSLCERGLAPAASEK